MLETHLKSPVTRRRLRTGPAADHIDAFADWLHLQGYKPTPIDSLLRSLAGWTDWMLAAGFTAQDFLAGFEACKAAIAQGPRVRYSRGPNQGSVAAASVFIRFLQQRGELPLPAASPSDTDRWPLLGEFRSWMRTHRGLTETTLDVYQGILAGLLETLGHEVGAYSAEALRAFVLERARPHGICRAKSIVVAVRSFVRFLGVTGRCPAGLEHALPGFASWQLASVPRFLGPQDLERVIGSCDGSRFELRDRAVLLLLARLGLRASEVAQLKVADIDWRHGSLTVCGKGRRQASLPLPQEVGDAMVLYLQHGRPSLRVQEVFTSALAPFRPLSRAAVTHIVRSALRRAGVKAPVNGAHLLRHSAATAMLRQGASLAGVGAVLRHRSTSTTAHYAKVDFGLLSEIAQPWPEVPPCS
jgi:integrase/recombinase XerD